MDILQAELNPYIALCLCNESIESQIPGNAYAPRITRYHELELITEGGGIMEVNDTIYELEQGALFYYPPGTRITGTRPYGYILIIFDPFFTREKMLQYQEGKKALGDVFTTESEVLKEVLPVPLYMNASNLNLYKSIFKKIFLGFVREGNNMEIKISLLQLLTNLMVEYTHISKLESTAIKSYYRKVMKCVKIIDCAPEVNHSLGQLAAEVGLSRNFLCSAFKELRGVTIFTYIQAKRIEKAQVLLIDTQSSIEEIANCCGFENISYFYRIFKRHTDISPAAYRQYYRR